MTTGGKILTGAAVVGGLYIVYKIATAPKVSPTKTSASGLAGAANTFVSTLTSALGYFGNQSSKTPLLTATSAPATNSSYTYGGVTYGTSGGAGVVDSGPSNFSDAGSGSSSFTPYAPGATNPGPYAPATDLMAGDPLTDTSSIA